MDSQFEHVKALPIIFALGLWFWGDDDRETRWTQFKLAVIASAVIGLVVAPWTLRNYRLYGAPVVISTNGGIVFWMGNTPGSKGDYESIPERVHHLNDYEQSKVLAGEARQFIVDDSIGFAARTAKKLVYMFWNESIGITWNRIGIRSVLG